MGNKKINKKEKFGSPHRRETCSAKLLPLFVLDAGMATVMMGLLSSTEEKYAICCVFYSEKRVGMQSSMVDDNVMCV